MRSTQNASKGAERYRVGDTRDVALCSRGGVEDEAGPVIAGADRGPGGSDSEGGGAGVGCCGCGGRGGGDEYGLMIPNTFTMFWIREICRLVVCAGCTLGLSPNTLLCVKFPVKIPVVK